MNRRQGCLEQPMKLSAVAFAIDEEKEEDLLCIFAAAKNLENETIPLLGFLMIFDIFEQI